MYTPAVQSCWAKNERKKGLLHILLNERAAALQLLYYSGQLYLPSISWAVLQMVAASRP